MPSKPDDFESQLPPAPGPCKSLRVTQAQPVWLPTGQSPQQKSLSDLVFDFQWEVWSPLEPHCLPVVKQKWRRIRRNSSCHAMSTYRMLQAERLACRWQPPRGESRAATVHKWRKDDFPSWRHLQRAGAVEVCCESNWRGWSHSSRFAGCSSHSLTQFSSPQNGGMLAPILWDCCQD